MVKILLFRFLTKQILLIGFLLKVKNISWKNLFPIQKARTLFLIILNKVNNLSP